MHSLIKFSDYAAAIVAVGVLLSACSKKEEEKDAPKITEKKQTAETSKPAATPLSAPNTNAVSQSSARTSDRKAAENMQEILRAISSGGDTIAALQDGWGVFDHPVFKQPASAIELHDIIQGKSPLLVLELRDPASRWNADPRLKEAVVGRLSLVTALFGSSNTNVAKFPEVIGEGAGSASTTEGDLITLQIVKQAIKSVQKKMPLQAGHLSAWESMAASQKPVERAIALVAFDALEPTPEQATRFYSGYLKESDQEVANLFIQQLAAVNTPEAIRLLEQFKSQPSAAQLMPVIDAALLQMKAAGR